MNIKTKIMTNTNTVSIAPSSTHGHFVKGAKKVIALDEINETFLVEGSSILETKNHTTLNMPQDCLITCQTVYNPFTEMYDKSRD